MPAGVSREEPNGSSRRDDLRLIARRVISEARDDKITTIAQALAYSVFLAIPAVLLVLLGVFSLVATPQDVQAVIDQMRGVIPPEAANLLSESLNRSANSPGSGLLMTVAGIVLAMWTITSAATTLMQGITTAFGREDKRGFVRKRLLALVIVLCLVAAAALVGGFLVFGPYLEKWLGAATTQPGLASWLWWTVQWPVLTLALLAAFAVLLYLGPDVDQPSWKWVTPGAIVALVIWLIASGAFSLYASRFGSYEKTWGTLSAVVVMLIWLWLTNLALLLGAEVNAEIEQLAIERRDKASTSPARTNPAGRVSSREAIPPATRT
jgi:membrane protein